MNETELNKPILVIPMFSETKNISKISTARQIRADIDKCLNDNHIWLKVKSCIGDPGTEGGNIENYAAACFFLRDECENLRRYDGLNLRIMRGYLQKVLRDRGYIIVRGHMVGFDESHLIESVEE